LEREVVWLFSLKGGLGKGLVRGGKRPSEGNINMQKKKGTRYKGGAHFRF